MVKKSVTTILGVSRSQAPWWRKPGSKVHFPTSQPDNAPVRVEGNENGVGAASPVNIERNVEGLKIYNEDGLFVRKKNKETCAKTSPCKVNVGSHANSPSPMPLGDCSNLASPLVPAQRSRKWTKLVRDSNEEKEDAPIMMDFDRRPGLESGDEQGDYCIHRSLLGSDSVYSCIKVALNFVSPENVGVCICLTEELHTLPHNHRAKVGKLEDRECLEVQLVFLVLSDDLRMSYSKVAFEYRLRMESDWYCHFR
ncbi:lysine-specific demethylase 3a-b [Quercus suber]|uniref:Lysine-specific demethylase 3a-b n=1 Tax=Quercus suber TaxID=58331 RepID=A0AAW0KPJ9_QUESU